MDEGWDETLTVMLHRANSANWLVRISYEIVRNKRGI